MKIGGSRPPSPPLPSLLSNELTGAADLGNERVLKWLQHHVVSAGRCMVMLAPLCVCMSVLSSDKLTVTKTSPQGRFECSCYLLMYFNAAFSPSPQQTTLIGSSIYLWMTLHFMLKFCALEN